MEFGKACRVACLMAAGVVGSVWAGEFDMPGQGVIGQEQAVAQQLCRARLQGLHAATSSGDPSQTMREEFLAYQSLVEEALVLRAKAIQFKNELRAKLDRHEAFSGLDLQRLNGGAAQMLEQRAALYRMSQAYECWLDEAPSADPQIASRHAMGVAMSLSAALILYDNYLSAVALYYADPALRQHLNRADSGFGLREHELNQTAAAFASPDNRARVRRGLLWFETYGNPGSADGDDEDKDYRYLAQIIMQSPSRHLVRRVRPLEFFGDMLGMFATMSFDGFLGLKNETTHVSSLLFGNTIGMVESRRGKLDSNPVVLDQLEHAVQAGDILLEKTPFRLTDSFIPGHWGHVAVWVGREDELRALGIWDHPVVQPHQEAIRAGRGIVEALRTGVEMNSLKHFLNIDDLAVLHQPSITESERREAVLQALRQVGKAYDYNFDVRSTDRIVCSELVYHTYVHLDWPTEHMLGRVTISPDNVAVRATPGGPLSVTLLYHDGQEITEDRAAAMARFVKAQVVKLARQ